MTTPGTGQVRRNLAPGETRHWTDPQMYTHVAFVPGILAAATRQSPLPELVALQSAVLTLSLLYHRKCATPLPTGPHAEAQVAEHRIVPDGSYERPGVLAKGEGLSAKLLFLYGASQTTQSPDASILAANSCCFALTLGAFVATNFDKRLYERWHPWGLHVVPGVWSTLVALHNAPLLPAALVPSGPLLSVPWPFAW